MTDLIEDNKPKEQVNIVWVVGRVNENPVEHRGHLWDLIGVCSSEKLAVEACTDEYYFVGPIQMNEILPKEHIDWPGFYHPCAGTRNIDD